jgi:hypothetical protein
MTGLLAPIGAVEYTTKFLDALASTVIAWVRQVPALDLRHFPVRQRPHELSGLSMAV